MSDPTNTKTPSEMKPAAAGEILSEAPQAPSRRIKRLLARSIFYQMLSFFFRYPEAARDLSSVKENGFIWRDAAKELSLIDGDNKLGAVLDDLLGAFQSLDIHAWRMDYEKNLGHTANSVTPAYELEYGEAHSRREPQELADITGFYNAFGLKVSNKLSERGDHVSVECEFMHYLIYKEVVALEEGAEDKAEICREAGQRFLSDHLARWFPAFARRLSKNSKDFMKKVAVFAFEFMERDCHILEIELGPPGLPIRAVKENEDSGCVSCAFGPNRDLSGGRP